MVLENDDSNEKRLCIIYHTAFIFNNETAKESEKNYLEIIKQGRYKYIGNIHKIKQKVMNERS